MPPLSAYTPFESLLFFQSLATSDARPASFASISNLLRTNPFVRQNGAFNPDRLSPEALEDLYGTLMRDGLDRDDPNGRRAETEGPSNPKKRKISSPRPEELADGVTHAAPVPELVAHLYAKYRQLVTREIRDEERRYMAIKDEIERLQEQEAGPAAIETPAGRAAKPERTTEPIDIDVKEETPDRQAQADQAQPTQPAGQPPAAINGQIPPQPPVQPASGLRAQQDATTPNASNVPPTAPIPSAGTRAAHPSQVAPRPNVPGAPASSPSIAAGKPGLSIDTPTTSRAPAQPSFQQWQLDPSPHSPYPVLSPKTATPQAAQATAKRPFPPPSGLAMTPSAVPGTPGLLPVQTPVPIGQPVLHPRTSQTPSAPGASFSESRGSRPRLSIDTPGSSTPWKRTPGLGIPQSPPSPVRPRPEDVSPISERGHSPIGEMEDSSPRATGGRSQQSRSEAKKPRRSQAAAADGKAATKVKAERPSAVARRTRAASTASSRSRLSVVSRDESPLPADDVERESRATSRRKGGAAAPAEDLAKGRVKRKRGASESLQQEPLPPETPKIDTARFILCTRNFHRTAAPIMNDVATHKLASIFAKPLAERDAPGYHDLIYRPQDLKTIKSAIHQGSKAVNAATEAASTPAGDGESPAPAAGGTPSKSAVLMLPKTEDLLPPKGIVNSAQLEKELIRMFANAIMFNPIPQRGFGPAFRMISERGSRESTQTGDADEGGIISDSLEMFDDVQEAVTHWRAAERTADELANKNVLSLRRGSVSDFNTDSADDGRG